jgi:hypothetical protein
MAVVAGIAPYESFVVVDEERDGLHLYESVQILSTKDPQGDLESQIDWDGVSWGHKTIMVGVKIDDDWHVVDRRE